MISPMNDRTDSRMLAEWKLTFVHPIRHPVVNGPDDPGVRDLIVDGHFRFRPIIDVVLIHVDQSVAARRPARQLQKNRVVPRQRALRSGKLINSNNEVYVSSIGFFFFFFFWGMKDSFGDNKLGSWKIIEGSFGDGRFKYCFYVWLENGEGKKAWIYLSQNFDFYLWSEEIGLTYDLKCKGK